MTGSIIAARQISHAHLCLGQATNVWRHVGEKTIRLAAEFCSHAMRLARLSEVDVMEATRCITSHVAKTNWFERRRDAEA